MKVIQILWKCFLFTFPFSLHCVLYEKASYRFGNFNPWVTGFVFLPEILLLMIFLLRAKDLRLKIKSLLWPLIVFFLFLLNAGITTYLKGDMFLFGFFAFHVLMGCFLYSLWKDQIISSQESVRWLLFGVLFQIVVALAQTLLNHSIGLNLIGEPHLGPAVANVAKIDLDNGEKMIRGYGTFLHPNILGAYLLTVLLISWPYLKRFGFLFWPAILLSGLYLTGSQAAWLGALFAIILFLMFKWLDAGHQKWLTAGLLMLILTINTWFFFNAGQLNARDVSAKERLEQIQISQEMVQVNPLGVGIGSFTLQMEEFSPKKLMPWEFQPVHNVYFLVMSEMGVQGLVLLLMAIALVLIFSFKKTLDYSSENLPNLIPVLTLIFMASFDHLLLTSYMGPLLIALALTQSSAKV